MRTTRCNEKRTSCCEKYLRHSHPRNPCGRETQCAERPIWGWAAVVFREESSKGTGRTLRGKGPGASVRIAAIMSGTAILQQGLTTTCKDPRRSFVESDGRSLVGRMSP